MYWISILCAAIVYNLVGAIWYSPLLFRDTWVALQFPGRTPSDVMKNARVAMIGTFVISIFMACILSKALAIFGATTVATAAQYSLWLAIGFVATTALVNDLYAQKPLKLYAITAGYHVVGIITMGMALALIGLP